MSLALADLAAHLAHYRGHINWRLVQYWVGSMIYRRHRLRFLALRGRSPLYYITAPKRGRSRRWCAFLRLREAISRFGTSLALLLHNRIMQQAQRASELSMHRHTAAVLVTLTQQRRQTQDSVNICTLARQAVGDAPALD